MKGSMSSDDSNSIEPTPHCTPSPPMRFQPQISSESDKVDFIGNEEIGLDKSGGLQSKKHQTYSESQSLSLEIQNPQHHYYQSPYEESSGLNLQLNGPPTFTDSVIDTRFLDSPVPEANFGNPIGFSTNGNKNQATDQKNSDLNNAHSVNESFLAPPYEEAIEWLENVPFQYNSSHSYPWAVPQQFSDNIESRNESSFNENIGHLGTIPTVLEKFPGFVRCVLDIAPEVVGWVIGRSGSHIKEMKHRSGCGMWVDQKDLKLYITGTDMMRIQVAAEMVHDLILKAPVNVSAAGVETGVVSHMIDCPPHLIGLLIGRGGTTIKRIKEESKANVVINQKMMKVIVSGVPRSVRLAVTMIEDVFNFGKAADDDLNQTIPPTPSSMSQHFNFQHDISSNGEKYIYNNEYEGRKAMNEINCKDNKGELYDPHGSKNQMSLISKFNSDQNGMIASSNSNFLHKSINDRTGTASMSLNNSVSMKENSPGSRESADSALNDWSVFSGTLFNLKSKGHEMNGSIDKSDPIARRNSLNMTPGDGSPERSSKSPTAPPESMSMEEYLDCIPPGLSNYSKIFHENEIDLDAMRLMATADFVEIGIPKGPAVKISYVLREGCIPPGASYPLGMVQFLNTIGLSKYAAKFSQAEVDIPAMAAMKEQDFIELGLVKGPRLKILAELRRLFTSTTRDATKSFWTSNINVSKQSMVMPRISGLHSYSTLNELTSTSGINSGLDLRRGGLVKHAARFSHRTPQMSP